ncbi:MAG: ankyrin repeat domain-containing protein, partial [Parachlamydiales bacterium]|jgi:hypothetical protein
LHAAALNNHLQSAEILVRFGAKVNAVDEKGRSALFWAAAKGHLPIVKLLIEAQASVDLADEKGQTPLAMAINNGHTETADFLLTHGADRQKIKPDGEAEAFAPAQALQRRGNVLSL